MMSRALIGLMLLFSCCDHAAANGRLAHYTGYGELGARYHKGASGKSFDGAVGTFVSFQAQSRRRVLRPSFGVAFEFISGNAKLGSGDVSGTALIGGIFPGVEIFPLNQTKVQPFIAVRGVATWNFVSLSPVSPKTAETTLALAFGFEGSLGVDFRYRGDSRAFRVRLSYLGYSAKISEQSGFQFNAYGLSFGLAF